MASPYVMLVLFVVLPLTAVQAREVSARAQDGARDNSGQKDNAPGAQQEERVALFEDTAFRRGFDLAYPSSAKGRAVERRLPGVDASQRPVWRLCQWATRTSLAGAPRQPLTGGAIAYEDATKTVVFGGGGGGSGRGVGGEGGSEGPDLLLELRAGAEYEARVRAAGEPWPHLLVEQDAAHVITLDRLARLELDIDLRLAAFTDRMAGHADPALHAAQFQLFLIVKDVSASSRGEFLWFGAPFFDSRQDFPAPHRARDGGKDDATGKLIYSLDGRDILSTPLARGQRVEVHKDLLPSVREALLYAVEQKFLESADPARYAAVNMNLGWEMPGAYDAAVEVRGLAITAVLPARPEPKAPGAHASDGLPPDQESRRP